MDKQKIDALLRHPLFLALLGTVIGSVLIPWIAGQAQKRASLQQERIKQAIAVMTTSASINASLNRMKTMFESFEEHALPSSPRIYEERWKDLEHETLKLYGDIDSTGWWWPWNIYFQGRLLGLVPECRYRDFESSIVAYNKNLEKTTHLLGKPWDVYLTGDPNTAQKKPFMQTLDKEFRDLQDERNRLTVEMAGYFK